MRANNRTLINAAVALALAAPAAVLAQDASLEEVQITGSRIVQAPGMFTPTPVTSVNVDTLKQMAPGALSDALASLPQFFGNTTPQSMLGGQNSGGSNVNLRGAGINRTLVLLDGRRVVSSNRFGTVDVNVFPDMLLKGIETVTGGASASYGTDAVAGVVNFLLDTKFEGVKIHAQTGQTSRNDGRNHDVGIAFGHKFGDRLNVIGSLSDYGMDSISSPESLQKRNWFNQASRVTNPNTSGPGFLRLPYVSPTNYSFQGLIVEPTVAAVNRLQFNSTGTALSPLAFYGVGNQNAGCQCQALPVQDYGVSAYNEVQAGYLRTNAFLHLSYEVNDNLDVYAQGVYGHSANDTRRESVALLSTWQGRIYTDNAFLPTDIRDRLNAALPSRLSYTGAAATAAGLTPEKYFGYGVFLPNYPGNPIGDTRQITDNKMNSLTAGFDANLTGKLEGWKLNGYAQFGRNRQDFNTVNGIRVDRLFLAMDAVRDPAGNIVCRVSLAQYDPKGLFKSCVPINLFGGLRNITPEAAAYIRDPYKVAAQWVEQTVAEISMNGKLPFGLPAGEIGMAFGASYRKDKLSQATIDPSDEFPAQPDGTLLSTQGLMPADIRGVVPVGASSTIAGIPGLRFVGAGYLGDTNSSAVQFSSLRAIEGAADVSEGFAEFQVPVLRDLPYARKLETSFAARYANYSGSGAIWAWKAGASWEINEQVRLRATKSRDVRAATLQERFDQTRGGATVTDPANGNAVVSTASFSGGNPLVQPEKADTTTIGFVLQPNLVEGLQVSTDWYKISIADAIAQLGNQTIVNNCYTGDTALCQYVIRRDNLPNGVIDRVESLFINLAKQEVEGVDSEVSYRRPISLLGGGPESIGVRLFASWLMHNSTQNRGALLDERAGAIGGVSLPKRKVTMNLTYSNGPWSGFVQGRYIDGGKLDRTLAESTKAFAAADYAGTLITGTIDNNVVGSVFYLDTNVSYKFEALGNLSVYANVTNLLDHQPASTPTAIGRTGPSEYNSGLYDVIGRRYVVGLNYKF